MRGVSAIQRLSDDGQKRRIATERYTTSAPHEKNMDFVLNRPFYGKFAWAFDFIIKAPVSKRCDFIENVLLKHGIGPGSSFLDAGTGTGNYAIDLAKRGYRVTGVDISPQLIKIAEEKAQSIANLTFERKNLLETPLNWKFDAILCRGVLNDFIDDTPRQDMFTIFSRTLKKDGILICDVRNWEKTVILKKENPVFTTTVNTAKGMLTFQSVAELDETYHIMRVHETHSINEHIDTYHFEMRCWTIHELRESLKMAGLSDMNCLGDYDENAELSTTDRIVVIAQHSIQEKDGIGVV